ncbi:hypothetical protein D3C80_524550 [compost metagenome]
MNNQKLFMLLLGCKPKGRYTEQHDVFFGVAASIKELIPQIKEFWPEADEKIHIDAWREVSNVDKYSIKLVPKNEDNSYSNLKLFFINLGGYKQNEFDEFHYKMLTVAASKGEAIQKAKQTAFFKHTQFEGANAHIDDKYGIDVDDMFDIEDILPEDVKQHYRLSISIAENTIEDEIRLGYFKLSVIAAE